MKRITSGLPTNRQEPELRPNERVGLEPTADKSSACKSVPDRLKLGIERRWFRANNCGDELTYQQPEGDSKMNLRIVGVAIEYALVHLQCRVECTCDELVTAAELLQPDK